jgi:hypothetical protein
MHINRIFFVALLAALIFQSCGNTRYSYKDIDKRKVLVKTDDDVIEAAVYDGFDAKKILPDRNYYWFDHSMIMSTRGGFTGELLHGDFLVQYRNYQIKEQGNFKYGLKHGNWKSWYENGLPKSFVTYKKGLLHGSYIEFDVKGKKTEEGKYSKGLKSGTVKEYDASGKYTKIVYKNGDKVVKKEKVEKVTENPERNAKNNTEVKAKSKSAKVEDGSKPSSSKDKSKVKVPTNQTTKETKPATKSDKDKKQGK